MSLVWERIESWAGALIGSREHGTLEAAHQEIDQEVIANPTSPHYVHSTVKGGSVKVTSDKQHRLLEGRKLPHTHVYADGSTKRVNE